MFSLMSLSHHAPDALCFSSALFPNRGLRSYTFTLGPIATTALGRYTLPVIKSLSLYAEVFTRLAFGSAASFRGGEALA